MNSRLNPEGRFGYEIGNDSGGEAPEDYQRFIAGINVNYRLSRLIEVGIGYQYTHNTSNLANRTYDRDQVTFNIAYDF